MEKQPYWKLKGFLAEKNIKQKQVADLLGISVPSFNKRLNGTGSDFSVREARKICKSFDASAEIFFN
ncbi:helix-turn-helix domain-containing protein [Clostridium paraputrificum]|uniref:helix-turn-helix domain-containing protein n=1 Tax=Clostridium paraputrificum TaxID=29363 RepID=UPI003D34B27B